MPHFHRELPPDRPSGVRAALLARRTGVLVAVPDASAGSQMVAALRASGFAAEAARSGDQIAEMLAQPVCEELPEVWVIDVALLDAERIHLLDDLEDAGCLENVIVILSGLWPRGLCPTWLDRVTCLHEPLPMPVFVEEVARLASPASIRSERMANTA